MNTQGHRTVVALVLQGAALVTLGLALLGHSWLDARSKTRLLVLVDRSLSVPRAIADPAVAEVERAAEAAGAGVVQRLEFAGRSSPPPSAPTDAGANLEPSTTNIEAALQAALAVHARDAFDGVVVVSDGLETVGDAARALAALRDAGLPLQWRTVGRPPPPTRITEVLTPARALAGQRIQITVQLTGSLDRPLRVVASARTAEGQTRTASHEVPGDGRATLELDAVGAGAVVVDVALQDATTGSTLDAWPGAGAVDVGTRAAILYGQGSGGSLARSLVAGGWSLNVVPSSRLDAHADGLDGYRAVVLDDVAIADAGPRFWGALVDAVQQRGLGLLVLGGERSFARGGYRGSMLESVLPVTSEPTALDEPVSVVFAVDKSGSMGQGSGGVDRFQLAQRAVLETARGLTERDALGLVVFDAAPRVLMPLGPARAGTLALARDWQASPHGGTRLAPALEAAIDELERAGTGRRLLILVTDGFVDDVPLAGIRARLQRSHVETIALAVGPQADVGALARLVGTGSGRVLRVDQAAELPRVMRSELERQRARVERGPMAVVQRSALPFPPGMLSGWPAIAAHAVTRAQPLASVPVLSERGEPLIAFQQAGRGRVAAVTSGLGEWTPQWLQWQAWPGLAGGLANWISGSPAGAARALAVTDLPAGLQLDAEEPDGPGSSDPDALSVAVDTPVGRGQPLVMQRVAPGRLRATLPDAGPGLYTFIVSTPRGTQRHLHLRQERTETQAWGTNPALAHWIAAGLASPWRADFLAPNRGRERVSRPVDRSLIGLALVLCLCGVVVDRTRLGAPGAWRRGAD